MSFATRVSKTTKPATPSDTFEAEELLPAPIEKVFGFFSRAENLELLTPPFLHFKILSPTPAPMHSGTRIEYRIRLHGIPMKWVTEITCWEPGVRFVDVQLSGPFRLWRHEHRFEAVGDSTRMLDHLTYSIPGSIFAPLANALFVRRQIRAIFAYRSAAIRRVFQSSAMRSSKG